MGRVKIPEIKSGDLLSSDKFNQINKSLIDFKVDESNISEEGINETKVPTNTVFDDFSTSSNRFGKSFTQKLISESFLIAIGGVAVEDSGLQLGPSTTQPLLAGESLVCRASARVFMADYGSRTFYYGKPPTIVVQLIYSLDESPTADSAWFYATGTRQLFSVAFSSKIPSDSAGDGFMYSKLPASEGSGTGSSRFDPVFHENRPDLLTRNDHVDGVAVLSPNVDDYSIADNEKMFFENDFSYTTAWCLDFEDLGVATVNQVTFGLAVGVYDPSGNHPSSAYDDFGEGPDKPAKGCRTVKFTSVELKNTNFCLYKVKK